MSRMKDSAPEYAGHSGAHTPGPYKVTRFADGTVGVHAKLDGQYIEIAVLKGRFAEANAHLIAAAPELLAACHDAAAMLEHLGVIGSLPEELNAAIAKAEGQP